VQPTNASQHMHGEMLRSSSNLQHHSIKHGSSQAAHT